MIDVSPGTSPWINMQYGSHLVYHLHSKLFIIFHIKLNSYCLTIYSYFPCSLFAFGGCTKISLISGVTVKKSSWYKFSLFIELGWQLNWSVLNNFIGDIIWRVCFCFTFEQLMIIVSKTKNSTIAKTRPPHKSII